MYEQNVMMEYTDREHQQTMSVLMLPWLAHGHICPFLELSKRLSDRNVNIYFCSSPAILNSIKRDLRNTKYLSAINFVDLHLPTDDLPPHYHSTKNLPPPLMPTLKKAFDSSAANFSDVLKLLDPDLVVYDFLQPWAPAISLSLGIPAVEFLCTSAAMSAFACHLRMRIPGRFPYPRVYLNEYELPGFARLLETSANGRKDGDRVMECSEGSVGIILVKSSRDMEGKFIDYMSFLLKKKIVPVGPLVDDPTPDHQERNDFEELFAWLDTKKENSTVFVSFGSEYFLSREEITEIAHGLEQSKMNFIWVIRFHGDQSTTLKEVLPVGFLERVGDGGIVLEGWAPQARILLHRGVSGFVSHCGWSSVMESMWFGIPIIAMPMHLDQPVNARLAVEEVGVGMEVKRDSKGRVRREEVATAIRNVMVDRVGERVRRRAMEMRTLLRSRRDEEMDVVVEEMLNICRKRSRQEEEQRILVPN